MYHGKMQSSVTWQKTSDYDTFWSINAENMSRLGTNFARTSSWEMGKTKLAGNVSMLTTSENPMAKCSS